MEAKIKPEDLRIGNYVNRNGIVAQVDHQTFWDIQKYPEQYKPIELTEEWLLKFGFKEFKDGIYLFWSKDVGIFQIMICSDNNGFGIRIWLNGTFGRTIYCIHDFQNLFYSLTGSELTINEQK